MTIFCGSLPAHIIYLKQSSFSALVSCHCKKHFNPHGQVGSRNTNGTLYVTVKEIEFQSETCQKCQVKISGRLSWGFKPQIYLLCCKWPWGFKP